MSTANILRATTGALAAIALAGLSVPATAGEARPTTEVTSATTATATMAAEAGARVEPRERLICVREGINSRIVRNFCRTAAQWENQGGLISN